MNDTKKDETSFDDVSKAADDGLFYYAELNKTERVWRGQKTAYSEPRRN